MAPKKRQNPEATTTPKKLGVHGFTTSGSKTKKLKLDSAVPKTSTNSSGRKQGLHTLADLYTPGKAKKERVDTSADEYFPDTEDQVSDILTDEENLPGDGSDSDGSGAELVGQGMTSKELESDIEEFIDQDGNIIVKPAVAKKSDKAKQEAKDKYHKLCRESCTYGKAAWSRQQKAHKRILADYKHSYSDKDEDFDHEIIPEDNGGFFVLEPHPEGSIVRLGGGLYQDTKQQGQYFERCKARSKGKAQKDAGGQKTCAVRAVQGDITAQKLLRTLEETKAAKLKRVKEKAAEDKAAEDEAAEDEAAEDEATVD